MRFAAAGDLSTRTAPPYDVVDEEERAALERADRHNAVRLILPRPSGARGAYETAAEALRTWRADGVLITDPTPRFYGYRMTFESSGTAPARTAGVIGALGLSDGPAESPLLPHERTLPKARTDRLELLRATRANLDPIWALSLTSGLDDLLAGEAPVASATDPAGALHELLPIEDPERVRAIRSAVAGAALLLADGHHRYETACAYRDERPGDAGATAIMAFVGELAHEQLCVHPIHRLVAQLGSPPLHDRLRDTFAVADAGPNRVNGVGTLVERMEAEGGVGLVDRDRLAIAVPRAAPLAALLRDTPSVLHGVDAVRFDVAIRPTLLDATVSYRDDAATVATLVSKGVADVGVLLRPVTVEQIRDAAAAGLRMPEKSTFFYPKPRTGMVLRSLDD